eukprot:COSAG04_NODE_9400_length_867_cov_1.386719_1_plen_116_part_01
MPRPQYTDLEQPFVVDPARAAEEARGVQRNEDGAPGAKRQCQRYAGVLCAVATATAWALILCYCLYLAWKGDSEGWKCPNVPKELPQGTLCKYLGWGCSSENSELSESQAPAESAP